MNLRPSRDRASLVEFRRVGAAGGVALSTTRAMTVLPKGLNYAALVAHSFATGATRVQYATSPYLAVLRTNDDLASVVDESERAQDDDAATHVTLDSFPTLANGGFLLIGAGRRFRGVVVDMDAAVNGNASVLTVEYWNGSAWQNISATDGTALAGATFGQDGDVTWTVPSDWARRRLVDIAALRAGILAKAPPPVAQAALFWTRWKVSAALDATTLVDALTALAETTKYAELLSGGSAELYGGKGIGGTAAIETLTDAGTARLNITAAAGAGGFD